jgi:methyl-accepting chemotaxis protein
MRLNTPCCRAFRLLLGIALATQLTLALVAVFFIEANGKDWCIWCLFAANAVLMTTLFSLFFTRRRKAYKMLRNSLGAFEQGSFNVRLPEPDDEEFGALARSINQVVETMLEQKGKVDIEPEVRLAQPPPQKIIAIDSSDHASSGESAMHKA